MSWGKPVLSPAASKFVAALRKPAPKPAPKPTGPAWGDWRAHLSPLAQALTHPAQPPYQPKPAPLKTWTPFVQPTSPPTGSYDPGLDAQRLAAQTGYDDLQRSTATQNQYAADDYNLALGNINTQRVQLFQDYGLSSAAAAAQRANNVADYGTNRATAATLRANNEADYGTAGTALTRRYNVLAGSQNQAARVSGQGLGGVLAASAAKRAEHQGLDRGILDTSHARTVQGEDRADQAALTAYTRTIAAEDRADQAAQLNFQRGNQGFDTQKAALGVGFLRGAAGRETTLAQAGRDNTQFGVDIGKQEYYQAQQAGTPLPERPAGEYVGSTGQVYRGIKGDAMHVLLPSGKVVPRVTVDPHGAARVLAGRKARALAAQRKKK